MTPSPLRSTDPRQIGNYRITGLLGEGGMGAVYLGETVDGQQVAVKVIRPELASDPSFRERFRSEVKRARQVPPFCTAEVVDADADAPTPYLVVEYVDGPSLADAVRDRGPLSGGALHSVALGVTTALAAIHDAGVIHRDLKPANVLFSLGTPKVIDFGIAKALNTTSQHTIPGQILGAIAYMSPERFTTTGETGPAADVFAWGAVIAYAATGHTPFTAEALTATVVGANLPDPDLALLPQPLRALVARALDPDPQRRPTAHELLESLLGAGAAGNSNVRAGLDRDPDLKRAAFAVRRTVLLTASEPVTRTAGRMKRHTLRMHRRLHAARWFSPTTVAATAAVALAVGLAAAPLAGTFRSPDSPQQVGSNAGPEIPEQQRTDPDREHASRGKSRKGCTLAGPIEATTRNPRPYTCPTTQTAGEQSIHADFNLYTSAACAAVWTHISSRSRYQVITCTDHLALEVVTGGRQRTLGYTQFHTPIATGTWHTLEIHSIPDAGVSITVDIHQAITHPGTTPLLPRGAVTLVVAGQGRNNSATGNRVGYQNVSVE